MKNLFGNTRLWAKAPHVVMAGGELPGARPAFPLPRRSGRVAGTGRVGAQSTRPTAGGVAGAPPRGGPGPHSASPTGAGTAFQGQDVPTGGGHQE